MAQEERANNGHEARTRDADSVPGARSGAAGGAPARSGARGDQCVPPGGARSGGVPGGGVSAGVLRTREPHTPVPLQPPE